MLYYSSHPMFSIKQIPFHIIFILLFPLENPTNAGYSSKNKLCHLIRLTLLTITTPLNLLGFLHLSYAHFNTICSDFYSLQLQPCWKEESHNHDKGPKPSCIEISSTKHIKSSFISTINALSILTEYKHILCQKIRLMAFPIGPFNSLKPHSQDSIVFLSVSLLVFKASNKISHLPMLTSL